MNGIPKNIIIWVLVAVATVLLLQNLQTNNAGSQKEEVSYSQVLDLAENGQLSAVEIHGDELRATHVNGEKISALAPYDPELITKLRENNIAIQVVPVDKGGSILLTIIVNTIPFILFLVLMLYLTNRMQGGGKGGAMSFGKSRAQMLTEKQVRVTFDDVAGVEEAKQELEEVVDFLKDPSKYQRLGGKIPKGVLLSGSPGTGKTLLARSVAGEAGVPFFTISGSDFVEMFVGVGASRVRDLFEQAKKNAPCIVFIDEIDAVGRRRGAGIGGGNDEREQTLNQMLVEMDGFSANEGVILIAATNRPDVLDPALLRPGRFDRQVNVPLPDIKGRTEILNVHMSKVPLATDVDAEVIARGTPGFSGADLANLVNEAALMAARVSKRLVDMEDFEMAKDKVMMGAERRSAVMTADQKKTTAYHEAGHAIVTMFIEGEADPLHKVTIIPRGRALGVTMSLPMEDKVTHSKVYLENQIAILMGGRLAEELILNQQTTGASNDMERATSIARNMVTSWGMSEKFGPQTFGRKEADPMGGADPVADETALLVDAETKRFIDANYDRAKKILQDNDAKLHQLAEALLEYETLEMSQIEELFAGKDVTPKKTSRRLKKAESVKAEKLKDKESDKSEAEDVKDKSDDKPDEKQTKKTEKSTDKKED